MKTIEKKILPKYFYEVAVGMKTFELRKDEDDVRKGDILLLKEWDGSKYTGKIIEARVTYVLKNCPEYGLMDGYCIIGIKDVRPSVYVLDIDELRKEST